MDSVLQELELSLLLPNIRKSARAAELLAEDFIEFGSSGQVFNKAQTIVSLQVESPIQITVSQLAVQMLGPEIALVTYVAHRPGEPPMHTLRSSIWKRCEGQWQTVFHQGTPVSIPK